MGNDPLAVVSSRGGILRFLANREKPIMHGSRMTPRFHVMCVVALAVIFFVIGLAETAQARQPAPSAELKRVVGRVEVLKQGHTQWVPAVVGDRLVEGDDIRAFAGAQAELALPDTSRRPRREQPSAAQQARVRSADAKPIRPAPPRRWQGTRDRRSGGADAGPGSTVELRNLHADRRRRRPWHHHVGVHRRWEHDHCGGTGDRI